MLENYNAVIPSHARQLVLQLGQTQQEGKIYKYIIQNFLFLIIIQINGRKINM